MILQALTRYYDILVSDPESGIAPPGYSSANVSFALNLSPQGELLEVYPLSQTVQRGKKTVEAPRRMIVPAQVKRTSGVSANVLCDNCTYVLGISDRDADAPAYAATRHEAFCQRNRPLLEGVDCPEAKAVVSFLDHWNPQAAREHPAIARHLDVLLKGVNLVFKVEGESGFVHEATAIRCMWDARHAQASGEAVGQCLVTGETAPVAILHPSLRGIRGANPTGATLVGFNARAYESYNRTGGQGRNAPVSEQAAFAYTTALNYLLSSDSGSRKITLGDATVVCWAESPDSVYTDVVQGLFAPERREQEEAAEKSGRDPRAERLLSVIAEKIRKSEPLDTDSLQVELDPNTRFYVLGLAPNAARVSVRFFHVDPFIKFVQRIMAHHEDMSMGQRWPVSLWATLNETVRKKKGAGETPTPSPLMAGAVMRAILTGAPYPAALFYAIITRVRADADDERNRNQKVNATRAGIIKAYLTRKYRHQNQPGITEVLSMSLNKQSTNQAYLLGRLFAVLEKAQQDAAAPAKLNATIKDRYFTSACATPATVFPVLLRLSQHHISKSKWGYDSDNRIGEIMGLLDIENQPFPRHLSLDQQGIFILGYYHQRTAFYTPRASDAAADQPTESDD